MTLVECDLVPRRGQRGNVCAGVYPYISVYVVRAKAFQRSGFFPPDHCGRHLPARMSLVKPPGLMRAPTLPLSNHLCVQRPLAAQQRGRVSGRKV